MEGWIIEFNTINYFVFGISPYLFCTVIGATITICTYIMLISYKKYKLDECMKLLVRSLLGMALGAKLFGFLTGIYRAIGLSERITIDTLLDTGIVYYGGLIGLIVTFFFSLKFIFCNIDKNVSDVLAVCIPLFHFISRIGCFLSGCCYGRIYKGMFSIKYITMIDGCIDASMRFPVQLLEALFEILIFIYLLILFRKDNGRTKRLLMRYLCIYSVGRFFLEFLRGDIRRGVICGVSFSQCISILILMIVMGYCFKLFRQKDKEGYDGNNIVVDD